MRLRRLTEHVREQNWFAVLLDFLIVVSGVFIGLQVANWNDTRLEKGRERAALDALLKEAEIAVAYTDFVQRDDAAHQVDRRAAVMRLNGKEPDNGGPGKGLVMLSRMRDYNPLFHNYEELRAAGDVALIRSDEIRQQQSLMLGVTRFYQRWRDGLVETTPDMVILASPYARSAYDAANDEMQWQVDWDRASKDAALVNAANRALQDHLDLRQRRVDIAESFRDLCEMLASELGDSCEPPGPVPGEVQGPDEPQGQP